MERGASEDSMSFEVRLKQPGIRGLTLPLRGGYRILFVNSDRILCYGGKDGTDKNKGLKAE